MATRIPVEYAGNQAANILRRYFSATGLNDQLTIWQLHDLGATYESLRNSTEVGPIFSMIQTLDKVTNLNREKVRMADRLKDWEMQHYIETLAVNIALTYGLEHSPKKPLELSKTFEKGGRIANRLELQALKHGSTKVCVPLEKDYYEHRN